MASLRAALIPVCTISFNFACAVSEMEPQVVFRKINWSLHSSFGGVGGDYVTLATVDQSSYFCFSPVPRVKMHSQDIPESKAKWAITLRCDTSEASWGKKNPKKNRSLVCAAEGLCEVHIYQALICLEELQQTRSSKSKDNTRVKTCQICCYN